VECWKAARPPYRMRARGFQCGVARRSTSQVNEHSTGNVGRRRARRIDCEAGGFILVAAERS
jgi:hypothetical protein